MVIFMVKSSATKKGSRDPRIPDSISMSRSVIYMVKPGETCYLHS